MGRRRPPLVALSSLTSAVGWRRPTFVASSSSTLAASATVVAVVGQRRPPLATSSSSTPAVTVVGQRRPPSVASLSSTLAPSATVVAVVGRRRPPLATSSSLTPASSASSSRVSASRPPLMAATAFVRSTAASPLLALLRGVPSAGSSLGVPPAISGSLTPSIQAARGGGLRQGDLKLFEIFISNPLFPRFPPPTWPKPPHLRRRQHPRPSEGCEVGVVDGGGRGGQFSFYLIWLVPRRLLGEKVRSQGVLFRGFLERRERDPNLNLIG